MKRTVAFIMVALLALSALFASEINFKLSAGQSTSASLEIADSSHFNFDIEAELDIALSERQGVMVQIHPYAEDGEDVKFGFGVGYLFTRPINNRIDLVVTTGPEFEFGGSAVGLTIFAKCDFDIYLGKTVFVRVGTGLELGLGEMNDDFCDDIVAFIPLPELEVGWRF